MTNRMGETVTEILSTLVSVRDADGQLDKRFEALRRPHAISPQRPSGGPQEPVFVAWGGIDASLGAIVRAAAACGWAVELVPPDRNWPDYLLWKGSVVRGHEGLPSHPHLADYTHTLYAGRGEGTTPEEALSTALVAAMGGK